ncbi:MAG: hypothetical protein LBI99_10530 [Propionibacteriaceae bacterium]|nr:hypothetical protein [Propionibacteriaceae bacterium]
MNMSTVFTISTPVTSIRGKTAATVIAVAAAVALPQALHALGAATGIGPALGQSLLPMFWPVLLVGLLAGPLAGAAAGLISPLLAFALSGMPALPMLTPISVQLVVMAAVAGLLARTRAHVALNCLAAVILGWLARLAVVAVLGGPVISVWDAALAGWPGLLVLLVAAPLLMLLIPAAKRANR